MSNEARQCPVSPQELREIAEWFPRHTTSENYYDARIKCGRLRALADWLEKPAPATALAPRCDKCGARFDGRGRCLFCHAAASEPTRCPQCDHVFCLCPASEPTRGAEGHSERWHALWDVQQIIDSADGDLDFVQHQLEKEIAKASTQPAAPQSELRVTREAVMGAIGRAWCHPDNARKEMDAVLADAATDEIMKLLEGQ